jgi:hypothetical protein
VRKVNTPRCFKAYHIAPPGCLCSRPFAAGGSVIRFGQVCCDPSCIYVIPESSQRSRSWSWQARVSRSPRLCPGWRTWSMPQWSVHCTRVLSWAARMHHAPWRACTMHHGVYHGTAWARYSLCAREAEVTQAAAKIDAFGVQVGADNGYEKKAAAKQAE